jgi:hypothetical protein
LNKYGPDTQKTIAYYKNKFSRSIPPAELDYHIYKQVKSAEKTFDKSKGASFATHLSNHLKKLNNVVHDSLSMLKSGRDSGLSINHIHKVRNELYMLTGEEPSAADISKKTGIPQHIVEKHMATGQVKTVMVDDFSHGTSYIDVQSLLPDMSTQEKKVADTIINEMPISKALGHTGLSRSSFYRSRNALRSKLREAYLRNAAMGAR